MATDVLSVQGHAYAQAEPGRLARLVRARAVLLGAGLLAALVAAAVLAPWLTPYGYDDQHLATRLNPPAWVAGGSWAHPLGTDQLGRDLLTRLLYGARASLAVGFSGVVTGALLGVLLGLVTGYYGGWLDSVVMRVADAQMAFPYLLLAIAIMAAAGPSMPALVVVLGLRTWVIYARTIRGLTLSVREREYVQAAQALGCRHGRVLWQHIFPNVVSPLWVLASVELGQLILTESTLSFLGLGVQPPMPSWGSMLSAARNYLLTAWWLVVWPGVAILIAVFAANVLGDGLRDALDPRMRV